MLAGGILTPCVNGLTVSGYRLTPGKVEVLSEFYEAES